MHYVRFSIPSGTIYVQATDVGTVRGTSLALADLQHLEFEGEKINGYGVFSGEILFDTRQECLSEIESGDPEHRWLANIVPCLNDELSSSCRRYQQTYLKELNTF
jgi:hypothetical protein